MNLSNIKKVALIADFNTKKGYPEYSYKAVVKPKLQVVDNTKPNGLNDHQKELKAAKKLFNKTNARAKTKPSTVSSNRLN